MLSRWRRRKERQQQVVRDADNLVALFGERTYFEALARAQHEEGQGRDSCYWLAVRREVARRIGKEIGLDTATQYLTRCRRAQSRLLVQFCELDRPSRNTGTPRESRIALASFRSAFSPDLFDPGASR